MPIAISSDFQRVGGYFLVRDTDLKGGFRVVSTLADRDAIPLQARTKGMLVRVIGANDYNIYELTGTSLGNSSWKDFKVASSGGEGSGDSKWVDDGLNVSYFPKESYNAAWEGDWQNQIYHNCLLIRDDPDPNGGVSIVIDPYMGDMLLKGDVGALSDIRFKTNVQPITDALDKLTQLEGYTYLKNNRPDVGIIAQELHNVLPDGVTQAGGIMYVKPMAVIGLLVAAIKELKEQVDGYTRDLR